MIAIRRILLILLMLTLGLQSSWAAVAGLCLHEVDARAATHLGHHAHEHAQQADDDEGRNAKAKQQPGQHADCATCHVSCGVLVQTAAAASLQLPSSRVDTPYLRSVTQGQPERLIRPPRHFLA
ncbi:hypothetical protein [Paucibacter sp. KCTC 42545]|uniref:hypothetical protein n=1 Tax=Paucibacter sp. KCTC 42545 TaxID=1768242 RepID=UPI000733C5AE|nr:hypothetical protein [Paucibacter sp. KCTC 42545]ALT77561.1 hypothetical protein AT984_10560 [Paucibacter sp. KCTC 42545]